MAINASAIDRVPRGYLTVEQWAAEWGLKRTRAREYIIEAQKLGKVDMKMFRVMTTNGSNKERAHFKIVP